jgi:tape measure domain-containing protein
MSNNDTRNLKIVVTGDSTSGQNALKGIDKSASSTESHIGNAAKSFGHFAVAGGGALLSVAGAAAGLGIKTAAGMEQARVGFTTMLGSGKKADAFLKQTADFAASTPFEFPDLVVASQRLLAMGFSAKQIKPVLTAAGDAVAAMGGGKEQIDQVTMALGQMKSKGKIAGDEILQLTEAGIPAVKILAAQYHKTVPEMQAMISKGEILSDKAIPKLVAGMEKGTKTTKGFGGMMAAQSKTLVGQWSNLEDSLKTGLGNVFAPFIPMISEGTTGLVAFTTQGLGKLATYMKNVAVPAIKQFRMEWEGTVKGTLGGDTRAKIEQIAAAIQKFFKSGSIGGGGGDVKASLSSMRESFVKLGPVIKQLAGELPKFNDVLNVGAVVMKYASDHAGQLAKALPWLAAGFILVKTAQVMSNVVSAASVPLRIAELLVQRNLARSNVQLMLAMKAGTASQIEDTAATNVGALARARGVVTLVGQKVATIAASIATKAMTAATWALGIANKFALGPILLIAAGVALLVVGVIYAFNHFKWFHDAVMATWSGIKTATAATVSFFQNVVWPGIKVIFSGLSTAVTYTKNAFVSSFHAIGTVVHVVLVAFQVAVALYRAYINMIITAVMGLYHAFASAMGNIRTTVSNVVTWFRNTAVTNVRAAIDSFKAGVQSLVDKVRIGFDAVKNKVQSVLNSVKSAFTNAKDEIGKQWGKLQDLAKRPVNFVIETVYNKGIRSFWNAIATKVGAKALPTIAKLAGGGGVQSNIVGDWVPLFGQAGEYMLNRKQVAKAGGFGGIEGMFGPAGRDGASGGHYKDGGIIGGIKNAGSWLADKGSSLIRGSLLTIAQPLINTIRALISQIPGSGDIADAVRGLPTKALDSILAWIKPKDLQQGEGTWNGQIQPGVIGTMQKWALAQSGKRYLWTGVGPNSYDCSGLVGDLWAIATGNPLYRRYMSTENMGSGRHGMVSGPGAFTVYLSRSGGHTAANVGGLHAEAYGGNGTPNAIGRIGTPLSFYQEKLHLPGLAGGGPINLHDPRTRLNSFVERGWPEPPMGVKAPSGFHPLGASWLDQSGLFDNGGILRPGTTLAHNGTGHNEYVSTTPLGGGVHVQVIVQGNVTSEKELARKIATEVRDELVRVAKRNGG